MIKPYFDSWSVFNPQTHENWLVLIFVVCREKNIFLPPFDPDSEWVMYYHRIKTLRQIDENGKKQYEFEIIKSRSVSIRKGLFSEMIKESIERYHRKKQFKKILKAKLNLNLEIPNY